MSAQQICLGALSLLLRHGETGCSRSAHLAAELLDRLADAPDLDPETRALCERACCRLAAQRDRP